MSQGRRHLIAILLGAAGFWVFDQWGVTAGDRCHVPAPSEIGGYMWMYSNPMRGGEFPAMANTVAMRILGGGEMAVPDLVPAPPAGKVVYVRFGAVPKHQPEEPWCDNVLRYLRERP